MDRVIPVLLYTINRFIPPYVWSVDDIRPGPDDKLAVSISGARFNPSQTFIDLLTLGPNFGGIQLISQRVFDVSEDNKRYASFINDSRIVTCHGHQASIYDTVHGQMIHTHTFSCLLKSVAVGENEIFIGLDSNKVIVLDLHLTEIRTITLEEFEDGERVYEITVEGNKMFVCTYHSGDRALLYNTDGLLQTEYKHPADQLGRYVCTSITVSVQSGLVLVLWGVGSGELISVFSLSGRHHLFDFDIQRTSKIRVTNGNRLVTVEHQSGVVGVYDMGGILTFASTQRNLLAED